MDESEAPNEPQSDGCFEEFVAQCPSLKDKDEETCYKEIFRCYDSARKGFIQMDELKGHLVNFQSQVGMTDDEVEMVLKDIDKNDDKKIDFGEFRNFLMK